MPLGFSTGIWYKDGLSLEGRLELALANEDMHALEISALHLDELATVHEYLKTWRRPYGIEYLSLHAPAKGIVEGWTQKLLEVADHVDAIVIHPDVVHTHEWNLLEVLGSKLVIENMDIRKDGYGDTGQMKARLAHLPDAGVCLDLAHAWTHDPKGKLGLQMIQEFWGQIRQVHISGIDPDGHHRTMQLQDLVRYQQALSLLKDVPIIIESTVHPGVVRTLSRLI